MKCEFCGSARDAEKRDSEMMLCSKCYDVSMKAKEENKEAEMKENVMAAEEVVEVGQAPEGEVAAPRCEITVGVLENGELYFNVTGGSADLLTIDGLLEFGKRTMKKTWDAREAQLQAARAEQ